MKVFGKAVAKPSPEIRELLDRREAQGLRFAIWIAAGYLAFNASTLLSTDDSGWLIRALLSVDLLEIAFLLLLARTLRDPRRLVPAGWAVILVAVISIATVPALWYSSVGGSAVPASYLLKTIVPQFCIVVIILTSLPGRPAWPLAATLASLLAILVHLALAMGDPRAAFTTDYLEAVFGPAVSRGFVVSNLLTVLEAGAICVFLCIRSRRTVVEAVELQASNARLSRYFSPNVARKIAGEGSSFFKPGGTVQEVAVLFADIRSFTALSESLPPDEVMAMLSDYHQRMVEALFKHGGTLDKFIGDGIMATFGTPEPGPDDAERAVLAGLEMKRALGEMNAERLRRGLPAIGQGIGIHAGPALVGNIGTRERLEYTAIGDTVNVASRLESACKETGRDFLVSRAVVERLPPGIRLEPLGSIEVKGKNLPIEVFAPRR